MSDLTGFNPDQVKYISARLVSSTDKEAAEKVGIHHKTVAGWKNKKSINTYIEKVERDRERAVRDALEYASTLAVNTVVKLMKSEEASVRLRAAQLIIEQTIGKPKQRQEITGADGGGLTINITYDDD